MHLTRRGRLFSSTVNSFFVVGLLQVNFKVKRSNWDGTGDEQEEEEEKKQDDEVI